MQTDKSLYNLQKVQSNAERGNIFLDSLPVQVHFLMIDKCNVKCIMCGGDYFRSNSGRMLTLEKFKTMATNLKFEILRAVVLAGAGDPLLNGDLIPIIRFINSAYPQITISVTTNGLGLTESLSQSLLDGTIGQVNISINSATRETYRRIMQIDGFDTVTRNARTFFDLKKRLGKRVSLQFSAAINRLNIQEMPRLIELAKETGADSINLFYTRFYPERIRHMNIDDSADRLENEASLFFHQALSDDMMDKAKSLAQAHRIRLTHEPLFRENAPPCVCTWPMTQLMVGFDGEVYPCGGSEVHFREKVEKSIYNFGNALKGPVDMFWNSETYRALRVSSRQGDTCLVPECKCCANVVSPNDVRSHIMHWDVEKVEAVKPQPIATLPLVTVIVPTYNRQNQLVMAVKSILAQTYRNLEIIVVNDNGADVADCLMPLNTANNITYIRHSRNSGLAAARNTGIRASRGKYIAYLDDDDLFYPDHLDTLIRFLEAGDQKVAYTDAYRAHQVKKNGTYVVVKRDVPYSFDFDYNRILETNFVPVLCFVHARSCLNEVGLFDESLKRLEDWDMWIRMSRKFRFAHIKKITCEFSWRVDGSSMSSTHDREFAVARTYIASKYGLGQPTASSLPRYTDSAVPSLVSIVILTFNQLRYTKECIESIQKHTPDPHEIIFVDNASTDGTLKWLASLVRKHSNYKLIQNTSNRGFAAGCNQAIEATSGEYILLLNNDVVVTDGWLSGMLECLKSSPDIGIVGPMTNYIDGQQKVPVVGYKSLNDLDAYAARFHEVNRHRWIETRGRVIGYCMLFRRSLAQRVGYFDERFGIGCFEDDDYCLRSVLAGFRNVIVGDVFIHHHGTRSFVGNGIDSDSAFAKNKLIYLQKWQSNVQTALGQQLAVNKAREDALDWQYRGEIDRAIKQLIAGIKVAPNTNALYWQLAELLIDAKLYQDALETLNAIPAPSQQEQRTIELRGYCEEGLERLVEASVSANEVLAKNRHSAVALNLKGIVAFKQGERLAAEAFFKQSMDANQTYGEPFTNLGAIKWAAGEREEALALLQRGFILSPAVADSAVHYHAAASTAGVLNHALALFIEAKGLYPNHRKITLILIDILIHLEKLDEAMKELESAIIKFNIDDGLLRAALAVREKVGLHTTMRESCNKAMLSLCMVVKDQEKQLAICLAMIKAVVQEIIIVDDGSVDRTKDVARAFGAQVLSSPPGASITDARNLSLSRASGDWVLVLDANETISAKNCKPFIDIITKKPIRPVAYRHITRTYVTERGTPGFVGNDGSYVEEAGCGWVPSNSVKLFARHPGITFDGPFPGDIEPSILRLKIDIKKGPVPIHNFAYIGANFGSAKPGKIYQFDDRTPTDEVSSQQTEVCDAKIQLPTVSLSAQTALLANSNASLTSIVILTFNELKYTKECVASISKNISEPHEIIFVDNASKDGTVKWLREMAKKNPNYKLIENKTNLGFARGCNQGIESASGEYILLLNNDVVVTKDWLSGMLECLNSAPDIGIIGPMTNNISGPQQVEHVGYSSVSHLEIFAKEFKERNRHRRIPMRRVVGFCMLFRRTLVDKIGLLDESFGSGNFEDDDYCLRATILGYRNIIAGDVFIHHYGSRSFVGNKIDYNESLSGNRKTFSKKWNGIDVQSQLGKRVIAIKAHERAWEYHHRGEQDKMTETLSEGIKRTPEERALYCLFAEILIDGKRFKDALDVLNLVPPDDSDVKKLLLTGYCQEGLEHYDEAADCVEKALAFQDNSASAFNLKGVLAYKRGDSETAAGFFQQAINADQGYGEPHTNLGKLKWAYEEREEAVTFLERGMILSPTVADIVTAYYTAMTACGAFERAEQVFREAKALYPMNRRIAFLLIDLLLRQEKHAVAMQEVERAMTLFGIDDGIMAAALEIRQKIGPREIDRRSAKKNTLSLCMIVKDEERHLAKCLMSVSPLVNEMIVIDTGSCDKTKVIATAFGAKVFDFPWTGNFDEARNYSLTKASGDWILIMDADEVISQRNHQSLTKLIRRKDARRVAYAFVTRNYVASMNSAGWKGNDGTYINEEAGTGWCPSAKVRLFPRDSRIMFTNPVHELVEYSLKLIGIPIVDCNIPIHHYGKLDGAKDGIKAEGYYALGKMKLAEKGVDLKALQELAIQTGELKKFDEAIGYWLQLINLKPSSTSAYLNLPGLYIEIDRYPEALAAAKKAVELAPEMKETLYNYAYCAFYSGNVSKSIEILEDLTRRIPDYPLAETFLGMAYCCVSRKEEGFRLFRKMRKAVFVESVHRMAKKLVTAGQVEYAKVLLAAAIETGNSSVDILHLRNECAEATDLRTVAYHVLTA